MEDLLSIVVLILYFVIAGVSGKNKKKKKMKQRASRSREVQFAQAFEGLSAAHQRMMNKGSGSELAAEPERIAPGVSGEGHDPCHETMLPPERESMRFEQASQTQMHAAHEGEDPCHMGAADEKLALQEDSPVYRSPIFDAEDRDAFAMDVLRGVVMSEVLARPASCGMGRTMKRGT